MTPDDPLSAGRRRLSSVGCHAALAVAVVAFSVPRPYDLVGVGLVILLTAVTAFAGGRRVRCRYCDRRTYCVGHLPAKCPQCKESWRDEPPAGAAADDPSW